MDERKLRDALKACLSEADFPPERQQAVLRAVRKDEKVVKRKMSVALVFAIVMALAIGGAAIAAGLGVFGQSVNDQQNEQSAVRLERLEDASVAVNDTQAVQAPSAPDAIAQPQTVRDTMLANLYERRFNLTLNQSYYDGHKLYYSRSSRHFHPRMRKTPWRNTRKIWSVGLTHTKRLDEQSMLIFLL